MDSLGHDVLSKMVVERRNGKANYRCMGDVLNFALNLAEESGAMWLVL